MEYVEFEPRKELQPFVRCLWRLCGIGLEEERVVPDGHPEIVLNRAAPFRRIVGEGAHQQSDVIVVGQIQRPIALAPTGPVDLLGVRFEPGGLHALLGVPMHELTDLDVEVSELNRDLHARLAEASRKLDPASAVQAVQGVLLDRIGLGRFRDASSAELLLRILERTENPRFGVPWSSGSLARSLSTSRRTLERVFREQVGLTPGRFLRIQRLQGLLHRLHAGLDPTHGRRGWAEIALEHGYHDQSHLIREFRSIAGTTPARYLSECTPMGEAFASD